VERSFGPTQIPLESNDQSDFVVDYDGVVLRFWTNVPGRIHDSLVGPYNSVFNEILGSSYFALGNPGFAGVANVVAILLGSLCCFL
jgi:hypothetical protein